MTSTDAVPEHGLTAKQDAFAREMAAGNISGAEAVRRAGYSEKTARERAYKLRHNPRVMARINDHKAAIMEEEEVDPGLPIRVFTNEAENAEYPRDRLRGAELAAKWLGQLGPDVAVQNNTLITGLTADEVRAALAQAGEDPDAWDD